MCLQTIMLWESLIDNLYSKKNTTCVCKTGALEELNMNTRMFGHKVI